MAVDVGFVEGTMAATTPNGSAISTTLRSSSRPITPTVFIGLMKSYTCCDPNRFFWTLSATTPYPVSSTARRANGSAWGVTASAIAVTMRSICSCVSSASCGCAWRAARASALASEIDARSLSVWVALSWTAMAGSALWEDSFDFGVGSRNDVHRDELSDPARGSRSGVGCRLHGAHVPAHEHRDVAGTDVLLANEDDVRRLHHRIGGFHRPDQAARFNHAERFRCHRSS